MSRRWNWDFEEGPLPRRAPDTAPVAPRADTAVRYRRRRGVAVLVMALVLVAVLVAVLGSHGEAPTPARAGSAARAAAGSSLAAGQVGSAGDAVKDVLSYTPFVAAGGTRTKEIALTFDDGPGPYTPEVLSVLEQSRVPATFFAVGKMERYFAASTQREVADGDAVGDHTQSHVALASLSPHEQHEQLLEGILRIELAGGPRTELFRPPYGSFNATTFSELRALGLLMVLWSVDTNDYRQPGVPVIVERSLAGARPGAIILMHDGGGARAQTVAALPQVIHALRARGYTLVTVPRLLQDDPPPAGLPVPHSLSGD